MGVPDGAAAARLAQRLLHARLAREAMPAPALADLRTGYETQRAHQQLVLSTFGGSVIGLKLGASSPGAMAALGISSPVRGPIFSAFTFDSPARVPRERFQVGIVEAEIGIRLGEDLATRGGVPSRAKVLGAIHSVFPAIEIADSRLDGWQGATAPAMVADLCFAGAWVRGGDCAGWRDLDLATVPVSLTANGLAVRGASSATALAHPWDAVALTVAALGREGGGLRAGDVVSTGSCLPAFIVDAPGLFVADFGPLGRVELGLTS